MNNRKIVFIVGPTASGKTALSIELAKQFSMEIISCDSMHVYKGLNIGTDKVSCDIRASIPHHLIDIKNPSEEYSIFDYRTDCLKALEKVFSARHIPLIVGGSGLYMKAVCDGLSTFPAASCEIRASLEKRCADSGLPALYDELVRRDPERAQHIHANDKKRIIRALEICLQSGSTHARIDNPQDGLSAMGYDIKIFGIERPRSELYATAEKRVDCMIQNGLVDEVRRVYRSLSKTTSQAVGYKELIPYIEGRATLDESVDVLKKNTRHLIKKQVTWFKKDPRIVWIPVDQYSSQKEIITHMSALVAQFLEM
jgi:tRNA dimethylallyltransferase